ncbi:E2.7.3.3 [Lepeophtheirus salmonis]|uniref:arginine kinase n=1 Tax=Lepeophtheirus salmonis TaxID=72036 RepID=A0A7R8CP43_LEPSM|nr:E2.7.3.3 [Lepeophtheirus salmonis]CAF2882520.1 E2.7.3.3 [Lepeophtheirus salmonis]
MKQLEVFDGLKEKRTFTFKSTLKDVIQSGIANLDSSVGVYAPEPEAYDVFAKLFDPIIKEYHGWGFSRDRYHPPSYFGDPNEFKDLDPEKEFIVSTRIRCGRSVVGFPFNPNMGAEDYVELEEKMIGIFTSLTGINYGGTYYALMGMQKEVQQRLIEDHFLFKEGDRQNVLDMGWRRRSFKNNFNAKRWRQRVSFSRDDHLGFLTFCPTNLGTSIRASVLIQLPFLASGGQEEFQIVADKYQLQVRGSSGEHTESHDGLYDVSNRERMGLTEFEAVQKMYTGIRELIQLEKLKQEEKKNMI